MMIYLLVAILVKEPSAGPKTIDVQTMVFKSAARCIRNADSNKKRLRDQYDQVSITCQEKKLEN